MHNPRDLFNHLLRNSINKKVFKYTVTKHGNSFDKTLQNIQNWPSTLFLQQLARFVTSSL